MNVDQLTQLHDAAVEELHARSKALEEANERVQSASKDDIEAAERDHLAAATAFDEQTEEVTRCKRNLEDAKRRAKVLEDNPVPVRATATAPAIHTGEEELVYSATSERSFFADAWSFTSGFDPDARERLERHGKQNQEQMRAAAKREYDRRVERAERTGGIMPERPYEFRSVGTAGFSGLTVPQYLIDLFAPLARAGAPMLNSLPFKLPLPASGMSVVISRLTTGTSVGAQGSENSAPSNQDPSDTSLTVNVKTYSGYVDVSRQAIERSEMVDTVVFQDMILAYFTAIDLDLYSGSGSSGHHLGVDNVSGISTKTYTSGSPTLGGLYPKVADGIQTIASTIFRPATTIYMHPRRWGWATDQLDSNGRPLVVPNAQGPWNVLAVGEAPDYGAVVGSMQGLPVITDANITTTDGAGTNQDRIYIERTPELLYWQEGDGNPRQFRFEQAAAPQSIRLAVWGYSAFTAGRYPGASAEVVGTGLAAPTF